VAPRPPGPEESQDLLEKSKKSTDESKEAAEKSEVDFDDDLEATIQKLSRLGG